MVKGKLVNQISTEFPNRFKKGQAVDWKIALFRFTRAHFTFVRALFSFVKSHLKCQTQFLDSYGIFFFF